MRPIPALLCVAGLAAAPARVAAGPSSDPWSTAQTQTAERFEWSTAKGRLGVMVMGLTPERAKQIMFTAPYANTSLAVYGPKNLKVKSAADLGNYKVVAAKGTTQELALTEANPKINMMRTEDDATAAAAYLSGQAQIFATNSIVAIDLAKKNPKKEFDLKFNIRRSPAHMGVKMGEHNLVRWLDSFIFFNTMNTELDKLHIKWLGRPMEPMPTL